MDQILEALPRAPVRSTRIMRHGSALVEISDDRGHGLDFIDVPHEALAPAGESAHRFAS